jgi:hypothetical protein
MATWVEYKHPEYTDNIKKWTLASDFYEARFYDNEKTLKQYLIKRAQGESDDAFNERKDLLDYTGVFPHVVDSLAGMLFSAEHKAVRVWDEENGGAMGDPEDHNTIAGKLKRDADGKGTDWETMWKKAAIDLIVMHRKWCLVDGFTEGREIPTIHLLDPQDVTNWRYASDGRLIEVLVKEELDVRGSIQDTPELETQYILYNLEGWQRYTVTESGVVPVGGDGGSGTYEYVDSGDQPILPIFTVKLPMRRHVGYNLARKQMVIMNRESSRDQSLRVAEFAKLVLFADNTMFEKMVEQLKEGSNVLQADPNGNAHQYITSNHEPARLGGEILMEKIKNFYITAFKEYADSARVKTATEVQQDLASGIGAFLELVAGAVDELENGAFWRVEQSMFAGARNMWGRANVRRSSDFMPEDRTERLQLIKNLIFPEGVPIGKTAKLELVKKIGDALDVQVDEKEVAESITSREATAAQDNDFMQQFGIR